MEDELQYTRKALELIHRYGFGATLITKSDRVLRDLDLLKAINDKTKCVVQMTLTTYNEDLCCKLEPGVCTTKARFDALKTLRDAGIPTVVCVKGHYVCSECHTEGMDSIFGLCLAETSTDPIKIVRKMMDLPFCHMHGPEHHVMVGAALLTAYKNAGGELDLESALREMYSRGKQVPGGACGFWGACGAGISAGQFMSIATQSTPLAKEPWGLSNQMTSRALDCIGKMGGPRCCKRDTYLAILAAIDFAKEQLGVEMMRTIPVCSHSTQNNQCIGKRCPFSEVNHEET